ncbi:MAG: isoprenoid biosynthesis glyoxalase ElbB [Candidatus Latescibacteria bacterium]|nr:isoprenoid biosynthesis glyoxalase ElbB [Candidatus Latescibacterota bacterium]
MKRVAVILSGAGVFDGSEIHEATAVLLALDRAGARVTVAAPSGPQLHVVDHLRREPAAGETRDMRVESARIARGPVAEVKDLRAGDFDAVVLPGGFGVAKNLCTFATEGAACTVEPTVAAFLEAMHDAGKVVGAACIAPVLVARVLGARARDGRPALKLTIGDNPVTAAAVEAMGARHVPARVDEVVVDDANRVVTTPAYMVSDRISEVFDGIGRLVDEVLALC